MKKRVLAGILAAGLVVSLSVFTYSEAVVSRSTALKTSVVNDTNAKKIVRENSAKVKQFKSQMQTLVDKYKKTDAKELDIAKQKLEIANNLDKILSSDKISDTQKAQIMQLLDNLADNEINGKNNSGNGIVQKANGGGFWGWLKEACLDLARRETTCPRELGTIGGCLYNISWDIANGNDPIHSPYDTGDSSHTGRIYHLISSTCHKTQGGGCTGTCNYRREGDNTPGNYYPIDCSSTCTCPPRLEH